MNGIRDLRSIATAPALEELVVAETPQLEPDYLRSSRPVPRPGQAGASQPLAARRPGKTNEEAP